MLYLFHFSLVSRDKACPVSTTNPESITQITIQHPHSNSMEKYQNKYRITSSRARWWDYGKNAAYFITICTKDMRHYFGEISNGEMHLSTAGLLADIFWHEIRSHKKYVKLDAFQVMPNHLHGILILDKQVDDVVETRHALSLQPGATRFQNPGKNTISSIIGSFKSAVTKHANRLKIPFEWQSSFHDHIIRNDIEFENIAEYISNNVANWEKDRFFVGADSCSDSDSDSDRVRVRGAAAPALSPQPAAYRPRPRAPAALPEV